MKITVSQLRRIIKEEIERTLTLEGGGDAAGYPRGAPGTHRIVQLPPEKPVKVSNQKAGIFSLDDILNDPNLSEEDKRKLQDILSKRGG